MKSQSPGMRRYLYESLFQQAVQRTQEATGKTIMVSAARKLRADVDAKLALVGKSMDDADLGISPVLAAIEGAMQEGVTDYPGVFKEATAFDPTYQAMQARFFDMAGFPRKAADGSTIQPRTGKAGPRLPISPYDPRWAVRSTVKTAGSKTLFVLDNELEQLAGGNASRLSELRGQDLRLWSLDEEERLTDAGEAVSLDDLSGMTELMGYMSDQEYKHVREWVIEAARNNDGSLNTARFMSPEALGRSTAILDELQSQGVTYHVRRDRNPGQIRAEIEGTKISVRLTEQRSNEAFVGRVYDDGVSTYYSTNVRKDRSPKNEAYVPSKEEAVALLRIAQGKPVERFDGKGMVGKVGTHEEFEWNARRGARVSTKVQDAYTVKSDKASMAVVGDFLGENGKPVEPGAKVMVRRSATARTATARFFLDAEGGEKFLREAVSTARENLDAAIGAESFIELYKEHEEEASEGAWWPEFSGDAEVAAIQRSYWDVLRGSQTTLLRAGASAEEYADKVGIIGELTLDSDEARSVHDMLVQDIAYVGSPEQKVLDHSSDVLDDLVGFYDLHERQLPTGEREDKRFDPNRVAKYMTSEFGSWRNTADIVAALRAAEVDGDELIGAGFSASSIKDRLIRFDESSAIDPARVDDPFIRRMGAVVRDSIERNGGVVKSLLIDGEGIVSWQADRLTKTGAKEAVSGEIGQIFGRGERGEVITRFAGGDNYLFAPGYEARIAAQKPGEDLSVEERTLLRGYEQVMEDQIQYQVASDMLVMRTAVGEPTSLNGVYRRLYDVRHDVDFVERSAEEGLGQQWVDVILATEGRRVRYPSEIASGSTVHAAWRAENSSQLADAANDNRFDAWVLTGGRNMAIMTEEADGFFDPVMTNGSVYQGITRYMVEGATVDQETGKIIPGPKDDRAPLMKLPETEMMKFDPYDRQQMSASNLLNASAVTQPVGVAMMTFGGWTADDPMVISSDFASKYGVRGADGDVRALVPGDKLSDMHGNKGVISLVVDREMDLDAAREAGIEQEVAWFKKNSRLDVVMSPFSAVSRFNGGTARELMAGGALRLDFPFLDEEGNARESIPNGLGTMQLIVTHKDVERGTRVYDEQALREGRGRKASSQLAWALGSQGADEVMAEFYGPNNSAVANFREMLVTMGMDLEPDGTLRLGYDDMQEGAERRLFEMPELELTTKGTLNNGKMKAAFGALIGDKGGDLELPFPLKFPTGARIPQATDTTWKLPVMSSHLRSGQDLDDGVSTAHDYTNQYLAVFEMANRYRYAQGILASDETGMGLEPARRAELERQVADSPRRAQAAFDTITSDLKAKRFSGRRNVFKEGLMSSRLPNSATAVWTSDPRLDVDQVSMGPAMAEALGLAENDYALIWRDPVLRDGGVRYLRVAIDERLTGVAINPVMDKSFDGDFDGDSVAVVRLTSDAAKLQAMQKLTVEANLLDLGQLDAEGLYPLAMQDSLDVKVSQHFTEGLADRFAGLRMTANEIQSDLDEGTATPEEAWERQHELVGRLSDYYRDAMQGQFGDAVLRFGDAGDHVKSVIEASIETGAKGSMAKIADYCRHIGVDPITMEDLGETQHTRAEDEGVMMATAVKSHGTGIAGSFSQRGVKALRNDELKAVLELTYPVTQSILQSKHDPVEAKHKYEMLMGPARALWKGRVLGTVPSEDGGGREWQVVRVDGKEQQADAETWKKQFMEFYSAKDGLNVSVNPENVEKVAAALTGADGKILDVEDPESVEALGDKGSTMDRLAYGGTFEDVMAAASQRENVFAGSENAHFAPYAVRGNQHKLAAWEKAVEDAQATPEEELAPWESGYDEQAAQQKAETPEAPVLDVLTNRDVLAAHDPRAKERGRDRRIEQARTVRAPRPLQPQTPEQRFPELAPDEAAQAAEQGDDGYSL